MPVSQKRLANQMTDASHLVLPSSGQGRGVLVLHAWWGLNDFFKGFCDRLAREGYVALAPDLYHGKIASTIKEAERLRSKLNSAEAGKQIMQAAKQLQSHPAVINPAISVIGFRLAVTTPCGSPRKCRPRSRPLSRSTARVAVHFSNHMRRFSDTSPSATCMSRDGRFNGSKNASGRRIDQSNFTPILVRRIGSSKKIGPTRSMHKRRNWRGHERWSFLIIDSFDQVDVLTESHRAWRYLCVVPLTRWAI